MTEPTHPTTTYHFVETHPAGDLVAVAIRPDGTAWMTDSLDELDRDVERNEPDRLDYPTEIHADAYRHGALLPRDAEQPYFVISTSIY